MRGTFRFSVPEASKDDEPATAVSTPKRPPPSASARKRLYNEDNFSVDDIRTAKVIIDEMESVDDSAFNGKNKPVIQQLHDAQTVREAVEALKVLEKNPAFRGYVQELQKVVPDLVALPTVPPPTKGGAAAPAPSVQPSLPTIEKVPPPEAGGLFLSITNDLNDILSRAMQPALTFIGMVAVRLRENDVRNLLAWNDNPKISMTDRLRVVQYADSVEEFIMLNRELGSDFLAFYLQSRLPPSPPSGGMGPNVQREQFASQIGTQFNLDILEEQDKRSNMLQNRQQQMDAIEEEITSRKRARLDTTPEEQAELKELQNTLKLLKGMQLLNVSELELQFAPAWAFEQVNNAIFRRIWSTTSLAAVEAAAQAVNRIPHCKQFTIKELISSPGVSDQFAFLVSASYLNSGDGIPPAQNRGGRGGNRNSTYINVMMMREALSQKIFTCNIWFETCVRRTVNRLLARFDEETSKVLAGIQDANERAEQAAKYRVLRDKLPQFELIATA